MPASNPDAYLQSLKEPRRSELTVLDAAIRKAVPNLARHLAYSGTMIGYGSYHYRYESGREGECPVVAISSRAAYISLYILGNRAGKSLVEEASSRLGKVSTGKACIRFKRLEDLDLKVALELAVEASALMTNGSTDFSLEPGKTATKRKRATAKPPRKQG